MWVRIAEFDVEFVDEFGLSIGVRCGFYSKGRSRSVHGPQVSASK